MTFLFLSSLVLPPIAIARLGESIETNQARYGSPVKNSQDTNSPILKTAANKTYQGFLFRNCWSQVISFPGVLTGKTG